MPLVPTILTPGADGGLVVHVTAKQWWWRMEYETPAGRIETANELGMIGRQISRSPKIMRGIAMAILRGDDEAARRLTGAKTARIVATQGLTQGLGLFQPLERVGVSVPSMGLAQERNTP